MAKDLHSFLAAMQGTLPVSFVRKQLRNPSMLTTVKALKQQEIIHTPAFNYFIVIHNSTLKFWLLSWAACKHFLLFYANT